MRRRRCGSPACGPTTEAPPAAARQLTSTISSQPDSTFACAVDDGAYATCTSPHTTSALPDGTHTFRVRATDAAGTLQAEASLKTGETTYTAFDAVPRRWGDYTGAVLDPTGGCNVWYVGEYSKITNNANGRWGTWIGALKFSTCT